MNDTALATQPPSDRSINAYSSADAFETSQRMAKALAASTLVPAEYRDNIPNVMIAMEMAARIGASPFAVMQNIDIIHGRPSWRSTFLIATVNACGRFTPLRYRFEGKQGQANWGCRAHATDRENGEECVGTLITISMANTEGWSKKKGSKWLTMPEQMLRYRAAAFWTRVYAPELSLGMHTRDEIEDVGAAARVERAPASSIGQLLDEREAVVEQVPEAAEPSAADPIPDYDPAPPPEVDYGSDVG